MLRMFPIGALKPGGLEILPGRPVFLEDEQVGLAQRFKAALGNVFWAAEGGGGQDETALGSS